MGIVFGRTGSAEPTFVLLQQNPFPIRHYQPFLLAEVDEGPTEGAGFSVLAKYIGVFGDPANESKTAMAMTAPVTMTPKKKSGVVTTSSQYSMGFVLPFEYTKLSQLPLPTDPRIRLSAVPSRVVCVREFSGWYTRAAGWSEFKQLQAQLLNQGLISLPKDEEEEASSYSISQYHPPFTLPFLRRNEVWVVLDEGLPPVKALLQKLRADKKEAISSTTL